MTDDNFANYKARIFEEIFNSEPNRLGFVIVDIEDGEDEEMKSRAMKELNDEHWFREYFLFSNPTHWRVRL